jgi:hypothetical protein
LQGSQVSTIPIKPNPSITSFRPCINFFFQKSKYARKDIQKNQWIISPPASLHIHTQPNTEEKRKEKEKKKRKTWAVARLITKWARCECPSGKQIASSPLGYLMVNNVIS